MASLLISVFSKTAFLTGLYLKKAQWKPTGWTCLLLECAVKSFCHRCLKTLTSGVPRKNPKGYQRATENGLECDWLPIKSDQTRFLKFEFMGTHSLKHTNSWLIVGSSVWFSLCSREQGHICLASPNAETSQRVIKNHG